MSTSSKPLSIWMIIFIFVALSAAVGAVTGYFNLSMGVRIPILVLLFAGLSIVLMKRLKR